MNDLEDFPAAIPPDVEPLRDRIRAMDDATRATMLGAWRTAGMPDLVVDGVTAVLERDVYRKVERFITGYEFWADPAQHAALLARFEALADGPKLVALERLRTLMLDGPAGSDTGANDDATACNFRNRLNFTVGRALTVAAVLEAVEAEAGAYVNDTLGPLPTPGEIIPQPVADADELADALDWAKLDMKGVIAAVTEHPARAAAAYAAELARPKPRKGVIDKLSPLVGQAPPTHDAPPSPVEPAPAQAATAEPEAPAATLPPAEVAEGVVVGITAAPSAAAPTKSGEGGQTDGLATDTPTGETLPRTAAEGAEPPIAHGSASSAPTPLAKYAAMLGRLGAEMVALSRLIEADLHRVDL